ncbi:ABC transporter ATP-binding protein [Dawidia soli]|uniref:ATP-binding cassette domain-containing protein n=1 Tax=Dawidia soli TaxID=2782352 RepID=A0AAP2D872_9BACT|nr:ATP-binding cassette domain-containing protein [Dawidia soli]MBT1687253.1 ATP-binding cassette domain-containing protein [Dawidia soli]
MTSYSKNEVLIAVKDVNLSYDKQILRDINFTIHNIVRPGMNQGQVISLIGRSGIGKTQLFKILAGLIPPNTGTVLVGLEQQPVKAGQVGIVAQNYILFNHRTVYDNLRLAMKHDSITLGDKEKDALINDYAAKFDLTEHLKKYPMQLSGGQRQRASIIQQVLTGNKFILLDEPFSGLDALMIDRVMELLLQVSTLDELNTLVIVSHDVENSLAISDTAFILARQKDQEGATITETLDLIEMGFAWNPAIRENEKFQHLVAQIKHKI